MPGTLFANSHCKMASIEKRRLATSLMVTLMPMNFPEDESWTNRYGSVKDHEVLQWVDYGEQLVEVLD